MTLKIEAGKLYRTRDGRKVGPMMRFCGPMMRFCGAWSQDDPIDDYTAMWFDDGRADFFDDPSPEYDIIAEWTDEDAATPEVGTLRELNVKPGDVVGYREMRFEVMCVDNADTEGYSLRSHGDDEVMPWAGDDSAWRIISRASDDSEGDDNAMTRAVDAAPGPDMINHPPHYTSHPAKCDCGKTIECIQIVRHMGFNLGNAVKYIWRADLKGAAIEDLRKAEFYIKDEIAKREAEK